MPLHYSPEHNEYTPHIDRLRGSNSASRRRKELHDAYARLVEVWNEDEYNEYTPDIDRLVLRGSNPASRRRKELHDAYPRFGQAAANSSVGGPSRLGDAWNEDEYNEYTADIDRLVLRGSNPASRRRKELHDAYPRFGQAAANSSAGGPCRLGDAWNEDEYNEYTADIDRLVLRGSNPASRRRKELHDAYARLGDAWNEDEYNEYTPDIDRLALRGSNLASRRRKELHDAYPRFGQTWAHQKKEDGSAAAAELSAGGPSLLKLPTGPERLFDLESGYNDAFKEEAHKKNEDGAAAAAAAESSAGGPSSTRSDQKDLMKHCTHEHDLMFKEEKKEEYIGFLVVCDGCQDPVVVGPSYTCIHTDGNRKCVFNLHKSCAERPSEIQHPLHRQHPLILLNTFPNMKVRCVCNACNQPCKFRYNCSICDFNLDLKCASNWQNIIENDSHKHQFTVLPKELADLHINCNVCGEYWSGTVYYMCSICQLLVHKECASFPRHITVPGHQHRLKLTWCVEDIYPKEDQLCKVCSESIVKCRAVYCCRECCGYVAHTECAIDNYYWEKENSDTTCRDEAAKLKHFSHQHELILFHDHREVKDDDRIITCEGCIRPITTSSFYTCPINSCRFFLHKICAELPTKMFLPIHSHPFTLLPRAPSFDGLFQCEMCGIFSQGFAYTCEECALPDGKNVFYLDLQCCIYWWENKALKHDSHVHRLLLNIEWGEVYCSGCRGSLKSIFCFSCKRCDFHLCIPCVELPLTARHPYDDHPLKLTYASVKNELGEYYCEICEGTRNQTHWFYYCKDCDFDCHPHCILGRYPHVKLGTTYKHDAHDQHLVALVDKSKSPIPNDRRYNILPCEKCKQLCLGLVFECKECNIDFHREGCCPATDLASSSKSPEKS